jgi:hypothetical protein
MLYLMYKIGQVSKPSDRITYAHTLHAFSTLLTHIFTLTLHRHTIHPFSETYAHTQTLDTMANCEKSVDKMTYCLALRIFKTFFPFQIRVADKILDKHSSLFCVGGTDEEEYFLRLTPGANVIKLFTAVSYEFS